MACRSPWSCALASTESSSKAIDADLAGVGQPVLGPRGRGLLWLGRVVGVGGGDAWVDAGGQALLGGEPAQ
jgi:hypothetical protein